MKIEKLIKAAQKPAVYTKGTAEMWVDDHISNQLLEVHLNPDIDLASRKPATIAETVNWIQQKIPGKGLKILDLGCGPGLYAEKLAAEGHQVTGMDYSANSIQYARESAARNKLDITYCHQDYLQLTEESSYDLVMMIFTDFGVLMPDERQILLANVHRALKPGGSFLFDVLNENYTVEEEQSKGWEIAEKGFWKNEPYLALCQSFFYAEQGVGLTQHVIADESGMMNVYRFWIHTFSDAELAKLLSAHDFTGTECCRRLIPSCNMYRSEDVTFCITRK